MLTLLIYFIKFIYCLIAKNKNKKPNLKAVYNKTMKLSVKAVKHQLFKDSKNLDESKMHPHLVIWRR